MKGVVSVGAEGSSSYLHIDESGLGFLGVMGRVVVVVESSGIGLRAEVGSSDFWRLGGAAMGWRDE